MPLIPKGGLVALHANDILPTNADAVMPFYQNTDLYYLTGVDQEETVLVLFPDAKHARDREILFVKETSELIAIWDGEKLSKEDAARVSGIARVEWSSNFDNIFRRLVPQAESLVLSTNEHLRAEVVVRSCRERWPLHRLERLAPLMHALRMLKEDLEIEAMRKACAITEAGFRRVLGFIRPGVGEWEIEAEYLHEFVRRRSRFAYQPIIGSGANACVLHYLENQNECRDGEMVLMDVGAEWARWNSDMTRTVPVNGKSTMPSCGSSAALTSCCAQASNRPTTSTASSRSWRRNWSTSGSSAPPRHAPRGPTSRWLRNTSCTAPHTTSGSTSTTSARPRSRSPSAWS
jgi:Xaa-Pro aminopeptidase